jgi:hypothetical protein
MHVVLAADLAVSRSYLAGTDAISADVGPGSESKSKAG